MERGKGDRAKFFGIFVLIMIINVFSFRPNFGEKFLTTEYENKS